MLQASALWWRILQNPNDTAYDQRFRTTVDAAIAGAEAWTTREPQRADAWFFLGAAYGARVSFRVQRGDRLSAARDGKRIKESLERALELDPQMDDARFGIGLYRYYADIAPAVARFLRFLLLLPGGDRVQGLKDMETVHERGTLLRGEADYQLHWIYLWYENQPKRALELLTGLRTPISRQPTPGDARRRNRGSSTSTTPAPASASGRRWRRAPREPAIRCSRKPPGGRARRCS